MTGDSDKQELNLELVREFLFRHSKDIIFLLNEEGLCLFINPSVEIYTKHTPEYYIGKSLDELIPVDDQKMFCDFDGAETVCSKIRITGHDGKLIYCEINCEKLPDGKVLGLVNSFISWENEQREDLIRKLSIAVEQSPVSIVIAGTGGIVEYVNPGFERMTGYKQADIRGKNIDFINPAEIEPTVYKDIWNAVNNDKEWKGELQNRRKSGELFWESATVSPIKNSKGETTHYMKVAEDISEQKFMMDTLIRSYEFIERVMDNTNPIFVIDNEGKFLMVNRLFTDITGYSSSQIIGNAVSTMFNAEITRQIFSLLRSRFVKDAAIVHFESELERKNGERRIVSVFLSTLIHGSNVKNIVGTLDDITGRKEAEEEISKLSRAIEQSPASVIITDIKGKIEYVNPKFTSLTGYNSREVLGKTPAILKSGLQTEDFYKNLWTTILAGNEWRGEFHNKKKNGELYWEFASISPYRNQEGKITHFVAVKEDITDRKKSEEALKISEEKLRAQNQAMVKDLQYAQMIIKQILPDEAPQFPGLAIGYCYMPLEAIGGDLFSFNELSNNRLGIFLGDVAGHGVSAALFLALVKSAIDRLSIKFGDKPVPLLQRLNRELYSSMGSYFLTAIYGFFEQSGSSMNFTFARGGHCPPVLFRKKEKSVELLTPRGKPIGMFKEAVIEEMTVSLKQGDRLFIYTDGIHETINKNKEMLGYNGLLNIIKKQSGKPLKESLDLIIDNVKNFQGDAISEDDIVLIGFEYIQKNS